MCFSTSVKQLSIILTLCFIPLFDIYAIDITGYTYNEKDNTPLYLSTVKLLSSRDSAFIAGTASEESGFFKLEGIKAGKYILSVSYIGYKTFYKDIKVPPDSENIALGRLLISENTVILGETTVVGVKTIIKVKEDTIEYNADSYKTQPNAVVEDLLKRLPGVEVDADGKITSQGKEITKILIDGKEFFSDDPKVASKNIPVNMVDKLQVVDRKSDLARITGVDDGEDETVINLTTKKGMNNGWFGNATAGYGTDNRYGVNTIINKFWDGNQISFIGGANNTNNLGFTDGNGARFRRFGGTNGINTSQNLGVNFNVGNGERFRVGGNVMYSHSDNDSRESLNRQYIFTDSTSYYSAQSVSRDKAHNIRGDFRLRWEIDSFNIFEFRPNFSFNFNNSVKADSSLTHAGDLSRTLVNKSLNLYNSDGKSYEFRGEIIFNHKFPNHPGRSFSAQLRYQFSDVKEDGTTYSKNTYYLLDSEDITDQIYNSHTWSNSVRGRVTWTEPLGNIKNSRFLTFAYMAQYKFNNADKLVYDIDSPVPDNISGRYVVNSLLLSDRFMETLSEQYGPMVRTNPVMLGSVMEFDGVLNEDLSNQFRNDFFTQSLQVGFKQVRKKYNLDIGLSLSPSMSKSKNLIDETRNIPSRWVWNFAPFMRYRYRINTKSNLSIDYRARTTEPSLSQLQPVEDRSNPLRIVVGNPNLKPAFTNNVNIRFNDFNEESQRSIMAMATARVVSNSIISTTEYDSNTGGQRTTYENVNGVWNARLMAMISMPFRNKKWQFSNNIYTQYQNNIGYINEQYNRSGTFTLSENVSLAFRTDALEIEGRPYYNLQSTHNTVQQNTNSTVHTFGGTLNGTYYTPIGIVLNTDITFNGTKGYSDGYDKNQWRWNATVSYQFLKGKAATVSLAVYDILQQKQNISRSVTASYIQDVEYNTLTRYFMLSFSYKFNTFGGKGKAPDNKYHDFNRPRRFHR